MRAWLLARSRFAEDRLAKAAQTGIRRYVLLGVDLDTFAFRNPHEGLPVYEVDHSATQASKEELLRESGLQLPESLHMVYDLSIQAGIGLENAIASARSDASGRDFGAAIGAGEPAFGCAGAFEGRRPEDRDVCGLDQTGQSG